MSITKTQSVETKSKKISAKTAAKTEEVLKKVTTDLMELIGTNSRTEVAFDQENDSYTVTIEGGDATGLLIGRKGETLSSIQTILGVLLKQQTGEWRHVVVNVGDYREKEEDYLRNLGQSAAGRAKETGEPQSLYNLNPAQRRIIHMSLSEDPTIITESMGEGNERYLVIKAK